MSRSEPAPSGVPGRREARERAVQLVYEAEQRELTCAELLAEQASPPDEFTIAVVEGVGANLEAIDEQVRNLLDAGWTLERLAALDRAVLRVGCFELAHRPDVPTGVVLSEAVELANAYGTDESGRFVNGLLGAAARQIRG